jgi:hypothetical protein
VQKIEAGRINVLVTTAMRIQKALARLGGFNLRLNFFHDTSA